MILALFFGIYIYIYIYSLAVLLLKLKRHLKTGCVIKISNLDYFAEMTETIKMPKQSTKLAPLFSLNNKTAYY